MPILIMMNPFMRLKTLGLMAMLVVAAGCENNDKVGQRLLSVDRNLTSENQAWLREHLPDQTLVYMNLPTLWNYLFDAKQDVLHSTQVSAVHQQHSERIIAGVQTNYLSLIPADYRGWAELLLVHQDAPLELVLINYAEAALMPNVAVATRLKDMDTTRLLAQINQLLALMAPGTELAQLDQQEVWSFKINAIQTWIRYEEDSGQLLVLGGMGANEKRLKALWSDPAGESLKAIRQLDMEADPSGLNFKIWSAPGRIYRLAGAFVPPEDHQKITHMGLDQIDFAWLGTESAGGQAALSAHILMPDTGFRQVLPRAEQWFDVRMSGVPDSVLQLTLPTKEQVTQAMHYLKTDQWNWSEGAKKDLAFFTDFEQLMGFSLTDMLAAYGQQFFLVKDQAGSWMAVKIKDRALFDQLDAQSNAALGIEPVERELSGARIHEAHFSLWQQLFLSSTQAASNPNAAQVQQFLGLFKDHLYWYIEDEVIYFSSVPQVLAEKQRAGQGVMLSDWLSANQGTDWNAAILAYGRDLKGLPRDIYHQYLKTLQVLADLAQVEVDLFTFPTASELNLPASGRVNLTVSSDADKLSVRFAYEHSFAESLVNGDGGLALLAATGVLVAIAVPAYHDYVMRAKISERLAEAAAAKVLVNEHWVNHQSFTGINQTLGWDGEFYYFDEESGQLMVPLSDLDERLGMDDYLYLEIQTSDGYVIEWYCYSDIRTNWLPASCR